jgi:hypothetical protein
VRKFIRKRENNWLNFYKMISVTQEDVKIITVNVVNRALRKEVHPIDLYLKMEPQPASKTQYFNYNGTHLRP